MEPWIAGRNPLRLKDADGIEMQSSLTPTVWVTLSLSMWLQDTTVRNTCCIHFYPLDLPANSGQLTSHALPSTFGRHRVAALARTHDSHHLPRKHPRGSTWMQTGQIE